MPTQNFPKNVDLKGCGKFTQDQTQPSTAIKPYHCVKCGMEICGGIWLSSGGPYCLGCDPSQSLKRREHTNIGWECPRCHNINSPNMDQCNCKEGYSCVIPSFGGGIEGI